MEESPGHLLPVAMVTKCSEHERQQGDAGRGGDQGKTRFSQTGVEKQRKCDTTVILLLQPWSRCRTAPLVYLLPDTVSAM